MIYSDVTITVKGNTATLDNDLYLYKNDKNITINISIVNSIWNFAKKLENNIIEKTEATIFTLRWMKGDKVKKVFEDQQIKKGKCEFVITEELIDEDIEMGDYDFQISLLDEEKNSILSIPPVIGQIHINKHIFEDEEVITDTNEVNVATVGLAKTTTGEAVSVVDDEGNYIKTEWLDGDVITKEKLNKIEEGIYNNSSQCKEIANNQPTDLSLDSATNLLQLVNSKGSKLGNGITLPISSGGGTSQYLHIKYSSTGAPQLAGQISDTPNAYIGLCVDTNADSPTNPKNYTWYNWKGDNGDTGATPNLQIGTVTTLESGSNATASITGTTENPVLNLGIPKGDKGDTGASGTGTGGDTETWEKVIETTFGEECYAFTVTQDKDGNPLQLKEGFIFLTVSQPKDTGSNLSYGMGFSNWESSFNGKTNIYNIGLMKNYEFYRAAFYFKVINNYVFTQCLGNVRINTTAPKYNVFTQPNVFNANTVSNFRVLTNSLEYVDKITVGLDMSTTGLFSADSIMEVWAKC